MTSAEMTDDHYRKIVARIDEVIDTEDTDRIVSFALTLPADDREVMQTTLCSRGLVALMAPFAADVPGADVEMLQEAVVEFGDIEHMFDFAARVPGADVMYLHEMITDVQEGT